MSSMDEHKDAFYVVQKGGVIGVYKTLSDFREEAGSSAQSPKITVYKGYGLPKETEEYLASRGLKNSIYSISADDANEYMFGKVVPCLPQEMVGSDLVFTGPQTKRIKLDNFVETQTVSSNRQSCILEFDGSSKGNPGLAGAGAVLRSEDGKKVYRLREGVGIATNNVAEYRAVILGMKYALKTGFKHIHVRGDSMLVCMQIEDKWKIKSQNLADLYKEARELKDKFLSFQISHVKREFNSEADALANEAIKLRSGQVEVDGITT
ncbi:hypothetical protein SLE2022_192970 [Rubroshorea leprosula]